MSQGPGFPRASNQAPTTSTPWAAATSWGFDGVNFNPVRAAVMGDGDSSGSNSLWVDAQLACFNGGSFDRVRNNSAANISSAQQQRNVGVAEPGEWTVNNSPAANTQATVSRAAGGAGVRHVCRSFAATLTSTAATAAQVTVNVRDGVSGGGQVLYTFDLAIPATANSSDKFGLSGLNLFGTANTAMTIEFAAAGGASTFEKVSMSGYDTI